ncbi:hypothetical protein P9112_013755 [Eukaryota sp. TZLM1-RC]
MIDHFCNHSLNERQMKALLLMVLPVLCLASCTHSCHDSDCETAGGKDERCACDSKKFGTITKLYARCFARYATSCSQRVGRSSCSIEGQNAFCGLDHLTRFTHTWLFAYCTAKRAPHCSIDVFGNSCEVIGENAHCRGGSIETQTQTFLVPQCGAANTVQCSVSCGQGSCSKENCPHGKPSCHCQERDGQLVPSCVCGPF